MYVCIYIYIYYSKLDNVDLRIQGARAIAIILIILNHGNTILWIVMFLYLI